ncbi:MAG: HAD family phosphatase [Bacteroidales bacterium]|nr:HAD family phosphatase [Candidatus Colicola faecequi]
MTYIFDLGGVLVDLNSKKAAVQFKHLLSIPTLLRGRDFIKREVKVLFKEYEKGTYTTDEFARLFCKRCHPWVTRKHVLRWWTSILLGLPEERKQAIRKLKAEGHQVYLLSNTSEIHWQYCLDHFFAGEDINDYFDRLFLSYEIGIRKPDQSIYEYVIEKTGCNPAETVYFDDLPANIEGGLKAGLQAKQVIGNEWIELCCHE